MTTTIKDNREAWLIAAAELILSELLLPALDQLNIPAPQHKYKVSCGFPARASLSKTGGQCWSTSASEDKSTSQIFISPRIDSSARVLAILTHELIHHLDDCKSGHRGQFARIASQIGFKAPLTSSANQQPELSSLLSDIAQTLPPYPHQKMQLSDPTHKKQSTRMIKIECSTCGFTARTTQKHLARLPTNAICPNCLNYTLSVAN